MRRVREGCLEGDRAQREERGASVGGLRSGRDRSDKRVERGALETCQRTAMCVARDAIEQGERSAQ